MPITVTIVQRRKLDSFHNWLRECFRLANNRLELEEIILGDDIFYFQINFYGYLVAEIKTELQDTMDGILNVQFAQLIAYMDKVSVSSREMPVPNCAELFFVGLGKVSQQADGWGISVHTSQHIGFESSGWIWFWAPEFDSPLRTELMTPIEIPAELRNPKTNITAESMDELPEISFKIRGRLITILLECASLKSDGSRKQLITSLPSAIRQTIKLGASFSAKEEVDAILLACFSHEHGFAELLDRVKFFDDGSLASQQLEAYIATLPTSIQTFLLKLKEE